MYLLAQNLLRACKEAEVNALNILDRALKEKLDEGQTIEDIKEVMKEYVIRFKVSIDEIEEEIRTELPLVTPDQQIMWTNYCKQIKSFNNEMLLFSIEMLIKIAAESFRNKIDERNDTCTFFRATIQAFQQTNFVELMKVVYKCSDDNLEDIVKDSSHTVGSVCNQTQKTNDGTLTHSSVQLKFVYSFYF